VEIWTQLTTWWSIGGISTVAAVILRAAWRVWRRPVKPSLPAQLWNWFLLTADREMNNQKLTHQLAARDVLIATLQSDLDRAVGIDSWRESHATESRRTRSSMPTESLRRRSTDSIKPD